MRIPKKIFQAKRFAIEEVEERLPNGARLVRHIVRHPGAGEQMDNTILSWQEIDTLFRNKKIADAKSVACLLSPDQSRPPNPPNRPTPRHSLKTFLLKSLPQSK